MKVAESLQLIRRQIGRDFTIAAPAALAILAAIRAIHGARQQDGAPAFKAIVGADVSFAVAQHNATAQENLLKQLRQQQDYASVIAPPIAITMAK